MVLFGIVLLERSAIFVMNLALHHSAKTVSRALASSLTQKKYLPEQKTVCAPRCERIVKHKGPGLMCHCPSLSSSGRAMDVTFSERDRLEGVRVDVAAGCKELLGERAWWRSRE